MCRYAQHIYKLHTVCFACRKMFRQPGRDEMARPIPKEDTRISPCPQCGTPMTNMGWDFKAPRQSDIKQWQKVQELATNGIFFSSCGCSGPGPRPATLKEVKPFLGEQIRLKAEWARQARITQRATELSQRRSKKAREHQDKLIRKLARKEPTPVRLRLTTPP